MAYTLVPNTPSRTLLSNYADDVSNFRLTADRGMSLWIPNRGIHSAFPDNSARGGLSLQFDIWCPWMGLIRPVGAMVAGRPVLREELVGILNYANLAPKIGGILKQR